MAEGYYVARALRRFRFDTGPDPDPVGGSTVDYGPVYTEHLHLHRPFIPTYKCIENMFANAKTFSLGVNRPLRHDYICVNQ